MNKTKEAKMTMSVGKISTLVVIVALVAGGLGFWGGVAYQKKQLPTRAGFGQLGELPTDIEMPTDGELPMMGNRGSASGDRRTIGAGGVSGEVTAKDDTSLTIKMTNGSTQTVYYSDTTTVLKDSLAASDDLSIGQTVLTTGTPNSDGSTTATTLRITDTAS